MKKGQKSDFKCDFYKNKKLFMIDDTGVNKILHWKNSHGTNKSIKYFIGYNDDDVIRPLCIKLPKWLDMHNTLKIIIILIIVIIMIIIIIIIIRRKRIRIRIRTKIC